MRAMVVSWMAVLVVGCGGAPFTMAEAVGVTDAGSQPDGQPDVPTAAAEHVVTAVEAAVEAGPPEAAPPPEATPAEDVATVTPPPPTCSAQVDGANLSPPSSTIPSVRCMPEATVGGTGACGNACPLLPYTYRCWDQQPPTPGCLQVNDGTGTFCCAKNVCTLDTAGTDCAAAGGRQTMCGPGATPSTGCRLAPTAGGGPNTGAVLVYCCS